MNQPFGSRSFADEVAGAVLAGGKSSRFGSDKAEADFNGRRLLDHALDALRPVCAHRMVAGTRTPPGDRTIPVIQDLFTGVGPLSGIHAALKSSPFPMVLVVAVDMICLRQGLLELIRDWPEPCDVAVPFVDGLYEPLCARYHANCVGPIEEAIRAGRRRVWDIYERVKVSRIPEEELRRVDPDLQSFRNVNTSDDLAAFLNK